VNNELWIDLHSLCQGSYIDKGHLVLFFQPGDDCITYMMRKAVRAVEFKITKIETSFTSDYQVEQRTFYTDIPEALWALHTKKYSEWVNEICVDMF